MNASIVTYIGVLCLAGSSLGAKEMDPKNLPNLGQELTDIVTAGGGKGLDKIPLTTESYKFAVRLVEEIKKVLESKSTGKEKAVLLEEIIENGLAEYNTHFYSAELSYENGDKLELKALIKSILQKTQDEANLLKNQTETKGIQEGTQKAVTVTISPEIVQILRYSNDLERMEKEWKMQKSLELYTQIREASILCRELIVQYANKHINAKTQHLLGGTLAYLNTIDQTIKKYPAIEQLHAQLRHVKELYTAWKKNPVTHIISLKDVQISLHAIQLDTPEMNAEMMGVFKDEAKKEYDRADLLYQKLEHETEEVKKEYAKVLELIAQIQQRLKSSGDKNPIDMTAQELDSLCKKCMELENLVKRLGKQDVVVGFDATIKSLLERCDELHNKRSEYRTVWHLNGHESALVGKNTQAKKGDFEPKNEYTGSPENLLTCLAALGSLILILRITRLRNGKNRKIGSQVPEADLTDTIHSGKEEVFTQLTETTISEGADSDGGEEVHQDEDPESVVRGLSRENLEAPGKPENLSLEAPLVARAVVLYLEYLCRKDEDTRSVHISTEVRELAQQLLEQKEISPIGVFAVARDYYAGDMPTAEKRVIFYQKCVAIDKLNLLSIS